MIASAEPGERWLYCYPHDSFVEYSGESLSVFGRRHAGDACERAAECVDVAESTARCDLLGYCLGRFEHAPRGWRFEPAPPTFRCHSHFMVNSRVKCRVLRPIRLASRATL